MIDQEIQGIAQKIGQFYLAKHGNDYKVAEKVIQDLGITSIQFEDCPKCSHCGCTPRVLVIRLGRVGAIIGKRGENINAIMKHLGIEVKVVEDNLLAWLVPLNPNPDQ